MGLAARLAFGVIVLGLVVLAPVPCARVREARLREQFCVPAEARVLFAEEKTDWPMGGGERIRFSLPDTMSPQEWLLLMAQRRKIDGYRMGRYHYDAGGDINSVEYFPSTGIYEARSYWD